MSRPSVLVTSNLRLEMLRTDSERPRLGRNICLYHIFSSSWRIFGKICCVGGLHGIPREFVFLDSRWRLIVHNSGRIVANSGRIVANSGRIAVNSGKNMQIVDGNKKEKSIFVASRKPFCAVVYAKMHHKYVPDQFQTLPRLENWQEYLKMTQNMLGIWCESERWWWIR